MSIVNRNKEHVILHYPLEAGIEFKTRLNDKNERRRKLL